MTGCKSAIDQSTDKMRDRGAQVRGVAVVTVGLHSPVTMVRSECFRFAGGQA